MSFMPESPYYLISTDKEVEAKAALQWLRGDSYNVEEDIKVNRGKKIKCFFGN